MAGCLLDPGDDQRHGLILGLDGLALCKSSALYRPLSVACIPCSCFVSNSNPGCSIGLACGLRVLYFGCIEQAPAVLSGCGSGSRWDPEAGGRGGGAGWGASRGGRFHAPTRAGLGDRLHRQPDGRRVHPSGPSRTQGELTRPASGRTIGGGSLNVQRALRLIAVRISDHSPGTT